MSVRSSNNFTTTPLLPERAYIGTWDNVVLFATAVISVYTDKASQLVIYQSVDKVNIIETPITITADTPYTNNLNLAYPYIYMTVRNTAVEAQTFLNFQVIYREVSVATNNNDVSSDVNIVSEEADLATQTGLTTINDSINSGKSGTLWANVAVLAEGVSQVFLSSPNTRVLSIFGNTSVPTTLRIQMSADGTDYYTSQYQILADGDFGYSLPCAFYSIRLVSSEGATIKAYARCN